MEKEEDSIDSTCLICFETYLDETPHWLIRSKKCECQKIYHLDCFTKWYKENKECPICHTSLENRDWDALIYHNRKWKILPFDYILNVFKKNDLTNIVVHNEDGIDDENGNNNNNDVNNILHYIMGTVILILLFVIYFILSNQYP
jgi:hypothetical protein